MTVTERQIAAAAVAFVDASIARADAQTARNRYLARADTECTNQHAVADYSDRPTRCWRSITEPADFCANCQEAHRLHLIFHTAVSKRQGRLGRLVNLVKKQKEIT